MKKLTILIIIGLFSCSKPGKNVGVKGRVLNPITNEGIPNLEVILLTTESFSLPGGYKKIKSTTTDENGNFEIYALRITKPVWIQAQNLNDYEVGWYSDGTYISNGARANVNKGKTMHADFHAVPYGNLRFHLHNQNCQGPNDILELYFDGSQIPFGSQEGLLVTQTGFINILGNPIQYPMSYRYYHWVVNRNGVIQTFYDTIFLNANEPQIIEVFY